MLQSEANLHYDDKDNLVYEKDSNGIERWYDYDERGNLIHYKDSNGKENWSEYDVQNNLIHYKNSTGKEWWSEYDDKGNEIYYKDNDGDELWYTYDSDENRTTHIINPSKKTNVELTFWDKNIVPLLKEYKDFIEEIKKTPSMDGERKFSDKENKILQIYNYKNNQDLSIVIPKKINLEIKELEKDILKWNAEYTNPTKLSAKMDRLELDLHIEDLITRHRHKVLDKEEQEALLGRNKMNEYFRKDITKNLQNNSMDTKMESPIKANSNNSNRRAKTSRIKR